MDTSNKKISSILGETDKQLLNLIAELANAGDLVGVERVRSAALQVRAISNSISENQKEMPEFSSRTDRPIQAGKTSSNERSQKASPYPKYEVRNGTLYRIGWSKKKKCSYTHRVPRKTVFDILSAMTALTESGPGPVSAEQIIARVKNASSISVPSYQAYAAIGFLRSRGFIEQVGRDGYHVPHGLKKKVESVWNALDKN